jgi:hypothetical protein
VTARRDAASDRAGPVRTASLEQPSATSPDATGRPRWPTAALALVGAARRARTAARLRLTGTPQEHEREDASVHRLTGASVISL